MGMALPPAVLAKVLAAEVRGPRALAPYKTSPVSPESPPPPAGAVHHLHPDDRPPAWRLVVPVPGLVVVSEANRRDHHMARHRRAKAQAAAVGLALLGCPRVALPVRVTLVRVGGKPLDPDNLAGGFKSVQDAVARWLEVDDGDHHRVRWNYHQRLARSGEVRGVEVRIRPLMG